MSVCKVFCIAGCIFDLCGWVGWQVDACDHCSWRCSVPNWYSFSLYIVAIASSSFPAAASAYAIASAYAVASACAAAPILRHYSHAPHLYVSTAAPIPCPYWHALHLYVAAAMICLSKYTLYLLCVPGVCYCFSMSLLSTIAHVRRSNACLQLSHADKSQCIHIIK